MPHDTKLVYVTLAPLQGSEEPREFFLYVTSKES